MWITAGRIGLVVAVWSLLLASTVLAGLHEGLAEMAAGVGAGTTLICWGIALHRAQRPAASGESAILPVEPHGERATV